MNNSYPTRRGFTLIEVMVSMVILSISVALVATIFNDATKAWDLGTRRVESNNAGRAVIDFIAREFSAAIADQTITCRLQVNEGPSIYGFANRAGEELNFVTLSSNPKNQGDRTADEVWYYVKDYNLPSGKSYALMRGTLGAGKCYTNNTWWANRPNTARVLVENVTAFEVRAYHLGATPQIADAADYNSESPDVQASQVALPTFLEVYLEVLDDKDAATARMMHQNSPGGFTDQERREFIERRAKRYTARIYPENREGYGDMYQ